MSIMSARWQVLRLESFTQRYLKRVQTDQEEEEELTAQGLLQVNTSERKASFSYLQTCALSFQYVAKTS